jgi:hypothetical protein
MDRHLRSGRGAGHEALGTGRGGGTRATEQIKKFARNGGSRAARNGAYKKD